MGRVIAYVRVSTDKQDLENQRHEIERYCSARGLVVDEWLETSDTIDVVANSAPDSSVIVAWSIYQNHKDIFRIIAEAMEHTNRGIVLHSIRETFKLDDGIGSLSIAYMPATALTLGYRAPDELCGECRDRLQVSSSLTHVTDERERP